MVPLVEPGSAASSRLGRQDKEARTGSDLWSRFGRKWQQGPARFAEKRPLDRTRRCWTAFARFQVKGRTSMQSCVFRLHVQSDLHQQAWQCWCNPASADTVLSLPDEDRFLLRGGVPSVRDWLHLWKAVRSTSCSLKALEGWSLWGFGLGLQGWGSGLRVSGLSFRLQSLGAPSALQGLSFTDSFVAADRPEPKAVSREAWRKMVMVFADHLRDEKRQCLRKAVAICIFVLYLVFNFVGALARKVFVLQTHRSLAGSVIPSGLRGRHGPVWCGSST